MQLSSDTIDQIVRNVMRQMQSRSSANGSAAPSVPAAVSGTASNATSAATTAVLRIDSKVISEQVLISAQAAGRSISLPAGSVITPSGRDYIRRQAVRVTSQVAGASGQSAAGMMISIGPNKLTDSAAAAADWQTLTVTGESQAAAAAMAQAASGIVVCAGGEPSIVTCLLNRNPAMRAAVITRATNLLTLVASMNPRVICLDSNDWSFGELLRLLRSLKFSAVVPAGWCELAAGAGR